MKATKYEIRPIRKSDNPAIAAIIRKTLEAYGLNISGTAYFDRELDHLSKYYSENPDERAYFVLTDQTGNVFGGAGFAEFPGIPGCAEIQKLYLDERIKGIGMGRGLLETVENFAACMGYVCMYLETHSVLQEAIRLYEKMGYLQISRPEGIVHTTMDRFYFKYLE